MLLQAHQTITCFSTCFSQQPATMVGETAMYWRVACRDGKARVCALQLHGKDKHTYGEVVCVFEWLAMSVYSELEGHAEGRIVTTDSTVVIWSPLFSVDGEFVYILEVGTRRPTSPPVGSPRPVFSKILLTKSEVCPATGDGTKRDVKLCKCIFSYTDFLCLLFFGRQLHPRCTKEHYRRSSL